MILYLVRHGETAHNRDGLGLGHADPPLTELGRAQAAALGARLAEVPVSRILSSPLTRAMETARAIAGERGIPLETRTELIELDAGQADGVPLAELRHSHPEFLHAWMGDAPADVPMPGGESLRDLARRLEPLTAELRHGGDGHVVAVSHNFVIKTLVCELLGVDLHRFRAIATDLAGLSTISITHRGASVAALNDCCHLQHLNLELGSRSV